MANVGNILLSVGFVLIILIAGTNFYTELNLYTENENFIHISGLDQSEEYKNLYDSDHNNLTSPDTEFQVGGEDLIFGAGYTTLKNVLAGSWLTVTTNILVTSVGFAPLDPVLITILFVIIGIIFILVTLGAIMNRGLIQR